MTKRYCECGRKIVFISHQKRGKRVIGADDHHDLCQRCWQALIRR